MPTPSEIARMLAEQMWEERSVSLRSACGKLLSDLDNELSEGDADELAESMEPQVHEALESYLDESSRRGVVPSFRWGTVDKRRLVGFPAYSNQLLEPVRVGIPFFRRIRGAIATEISPDMFEQLCAKFLSLMGCAPTYTTVTSHDGGIDFIGAGQFDRPTLPVDLDARARTLGRINFIVVGQAKQCAIDRRVRTEDIRAFYGSALIATRLADSASHYTQADRLLKTVGYRAALPVVLLFVTTSDFVRDAHELASRLGIVEVDGEQLAQTLAVNGVGLVRGESGLAFDCAALEAWVRGENPPQRT